MGFRSVIIGEHTSFKYPKWFRDKYGEGFEYIGPLRSSYERKLYTPELMEDIQRAYVESEVHELNYPVSIVALHECGGITLVKIYKDKILYLHPTGWSDEGVFAHGYCYGCSDKPTMDKLDGQDPRLVLAEDLVTFYKDTLHNERKLWSKRVDDLTRRLRETFNKNEDT